MKGRVATCIILLLLNFSDALAQTDSTQPHFRISSFSIGFGMLTNQTPAVSQNDYKKIAPNNSLINVDLTGYTNGTRILNGNGYININVGFSGVDRKTKSYNLQKEHRIGMRYYSEDILYVSYNQTIHTDSLILPSTPYKVSTDTSKNYNYSISSNTFMFDFGTIYQSNPKFLLTGYVGYNVGLGTTFQSSATADFSSNVASSSSNLKYSNKSNGFILEETPLRNSFVANASVVWGASLRCAKTKKFWSKFLLNLEGRFGVNSQNIQNYGKFTRMVICGHFGFKFLL